MKLAYVEMAGFRGFRDRVRVEFGDGFTILCGRNGVGKSTLFDGVEFAITGTIGKYDVEKSAKESLADYIWWRGAGDADAYYVKLGFALEGGQIFEIERSRDKGLSVAEHELESALCSEIKPENALAQLCKTSIIRDEWIAALSVDLSETDRFDLVRSALGPAEGAGLLAKAKDVIKSSEAKQEALEDRYKAIRTELTLHVAQVSELRDAIARAGDLSAAGNVIQREIPNLQGDIISQLDAVRSALAKRRRDLDNMYEAAVLSHEVSARRRELESPDYLQAREVAKSQLSEALGADEIAQTALDAAKSALQRLEAENATATLLLDLVDNGHKLGLNDGHCPLCDAVRSDSEFLAGIERARVRASAMVGELSRARDAANAAEGEAAGPKQRLAEARERSDEFARRDLSFSEMQSGHIAFFSSRGLNPRLADEPEAMDRENEVERNRLIELESAMRTLESSQSVSQLSAVEARIAKMRVDSDELSNAVERAQEAVSSAKTLERAVRRVSGEIIDERLAQISPLLNEIYQRLQPHADWRTIDYRIRGDVRRFLSLQVGEGLNPQFVFSSGQRRAAGLAFLLSVHLSRPWAKWNTLLLDDPVQHIDDFRALQLTEVLAAIRQDNRQIVCAVEDASLADLLGRRLSGNGIGQGRRVDFDVLPSGTAGISLDRHLPMMMDGVLRRDLPKVVDSRAEG